MTRKVNPKRELFTVMCENYHLDKETGIGIQPHFTLYSAPTVRVMANSLAENLKRCNKSYRIVTNDDVLPGSRVVAFWYRKDFVPVDGREDKCKLCKRLLNNLNDSRSVDCGGDCLQCMASIAEDPDCMKSIQEIERRERECMNEELVKCLMTNFNNDFADWQEIQGSNSMDFPVDFDNLMHAIEVWRLEGLPVRVAEKGE